MFKDGYITNAKNGNVFEVDGAKDVEAMRCSVKTKKTGANQRWRIVYVDTVSD